MQFCLQIKQTKFTELKTYCNEIWVKYVLARVIRVHSYIGIRVHYVLAYLAHERYAMKNIKYKSRIKISINLPLEENHIMSTWYFILTIHQKILFIYSIKIF